MIFEQIIIIGSGTIASNILESLLRYQPYLFTISYRAHSLSSLQHIAKKHAIPYLHFHSSQELDMFFATLSAHTLIISANNHYLFKESALCKANLKIINFHNALLPNHKGVNAPVWSIYQQDNKSGITWHIVNNQIDSGDILIQKELELSSDMTSLFLFRVLMNLGFQAFVELQEDLLLWNLTPQPMLQSNDKPHKARDLPNSGFLDVTWHEKQMSAFLRSMDAFNVLPKPRLSIQNHVFVIMKYWLNKDKLAKLATQETMLLQIGNITLALCLESQSSIKENNVALANCAHILSPRYDTGGGGRYPYK
ncbi:hypothetical protein CQA66_00040 [Helicobacter aurati]|uniref:Formyl transferase N-terminal domain-containing protein n=1 Tax=Helicobacter aurati TaxID=137778 RepID=A0A3D8J8V0_9HELI|nr:formyltransferase family protein [Helicobacter aurati]RDU73625.1 hypothetical protein CQA66_00040 [Helicobacter aurati]